MVKLFQYTNYIDYEELINKPKINHVEVVGDKSLEEYGIQPAGNYAHLNDKGKVPFEELDESLLGNLQFQGVWDAEHNNPELPLVPEHRGQYWIVSHGGQRFELEFSKGDWIIAGNSAWQKIDNTDLVVSVNGKTGKVVLTSADVNHNDKTVAETLDSKQDELTPGKNIKIEDNVISAEFTEAIMDYNLLYHHPSINGVELVGKKSLEDLDIQRIMKAGDSIYLTKSDSNKMTDVINAYHATEVQTGVAKIATTEDVSLGTDDTKIVTPKKLKGVIDSLEEKIETETSRATAAEKVLGQKIEEETSRAEKSEQSLNENILEEATRAKGVEQSLQETIDIETARAKGVEESLSQQLSEESSRAETAENDLTDKLLQETSRADGVEKTLDSKIDDEISRASGVENDLTQKIETVESTLTESLSTESSRALEAEKALGEDLKLKANSSDLATVATTGSYNDLTDVPTIPSKTSELENDSDFITSQTADEIYMKKADLDSKADITYVDEEVAKKQDILKFDATPTANSVNPVESKGIKTAIDAKQDIITGSSGEVLFHNGKNVYTQSILNQGFVVLNDEDMNKCKNNSPSFSDVFKTWRKFSHLNGIDNAVPSEISSWTYEGGADTIVQPVNSTSYVGFVSPKTYSSYDVTVRLYSTGPDDDAIGLVAAFAVDSQGKEHTLSFLRSPGGTGGRWICKVDHCDFTFTTTTYNQIVLEDKSSTVMGVADVNWNTVTIGTGTVVHINRSGNVFTGTCSQFNSNVLDPATTITIDLDELSSQYPVLNLFKGSSSWGYSSFSQPNSMYKNISLTDPDGYIFDVKNDKVLKYDSATSSWKEVSGQKPSTSIGAGRFSYNKTTGKLFFCTGSEIIQIATNADV